MKRFIAFGLFLLVSLPMAAVEGGKVKYAGGTVPGIDSGATGELNTTSNTALIFQNSGTKLEIPYAAIQSSQYSRELARHLGFLPAIAVGLLRARQRRHFFHISYRDPNNVPQVAVFEVPKQMPRTLQAVLDARARQPVKSSPPCGCGDSGEW